MLKEFNLAAEKGDIGALRTILADKKNLLRCHYGDFADHIEDHLLFDKQEIEESILRKNLEIAYNYGQLDFAMYLIDWSFLNGYINSSFLANPESGPSRFKGERKQEVLRAQAQMLANWHRKLFLNKPEIKESKIRFIMTNFNIDKHFEAFALFLKEFEPSQETMVFLLKEVAQVGYKRRGDFIRALVKAGADPKQLSLQHQKRVQKALEDASASEA